MSKNKSEYLINRHDNQYEVVIGLEVHAQVTSESKLFSTSATKFGAEPNTQVSLVDAAFPGMLPVINEYCVKQAIKTGIGLKAKINKRSVFDRKNYFYADLPQGYQISQFKDPIVGEGKVILDMPDGQKEVGIERLHLEQDAGKSIHDLDPKNTFVDLNRSGVALMEIVSKPDLRSPDEVNGGSSGGSSSAVAAQLTPITIGTDTGGSIRQPASFTGTVGLKPTYGSCSRYGIVAFASSLDQAGPMAQNVKDCALLQEVISTYDEKDSTSIDFKRNEYSKELTKDIKGKKIGIPKEYRVDGMPKEIEDLWKKGIEYAKDCGAEIIDISLPHTNYALPTYYIVAPAEASSNLARYDGVKYGFRAEGENLIDMYEKTRSEGFGAEVQRRIMIGTYVLSSGYYDAYYLKAQKVRKLIKNDFDDAYKKVDAILTPSTPSSAFKIGEKTNDPVSMYLNDIFTVPVNLAGLPGISIPAGHDAKGYPLGLQIIGKAFDEQNILNIAYAMEEKINFKNNITDWWIK